MNIKMTAHSVNDPDDEKEIVQWHGTLTTLFDDWRNNGTDCGEQTGQSEDEIRYELESTGTYQIDGFVGCYHVLTVVT